MVTKKVRKNELGSIGDNGQHSGRQWWLGAKGWLGKEGEEYRKGKE